MTQAATARNFTQLAEAQTPQAALEDAIETLVSAVLSGQITFPHLKKRLLEACVLKAPCGLSEAARITGLGRSTLYRYRPAE